MIYKHIKRGTSYAIIDLIQAHTDISEGAVVICEGPMRFNSNYRAAGNINEDETIVLYVGQDFNAWARSAREFFDGRFELV